MNTEQKHNKCQILLVIIIYYSFFFLRGLPGFNIEVALSLVSFPVQSPVLGAGQEEVGVVGYIVPRNQTVLCPLMRILHKI